MDIERRRNRPDNWPGAITGLILRLLIAAAVLYFVYRVGFIIVMVLVSVMLALTVAPIVDWLENTPPLRLLPRHGRRGTATAIVFLLLAAALVGLGFYIVQPLAAEIRQFAANWPRFQQEWTSRVEWFQLRYAEAPPEVRQWIEEHGARDIGARVGAQLQHMAERVAESTIHSGMLLVELILIPVLAFSFLTESRPLKREFTMLLPRERMRDGLYVIRQIGVILQSYAIGQLILALIAGVVVWMLTVSLGIRYPLAMATIAAVTRVIPVIGPLVGGVPILLIASLQGWDRGLIFVIAFTLMHLIESKVIMPRIIGYRINLHPAIVIVVLLIGAEFWGMWGMFLAAPIAAIIKVLFFHFLVRPRLRRTPRPPRAPAPKAPVTEKGLEVERPAVAGVRGHSGAH